MSRVKFIVCLVGFLLGYNSAAVTQRRAATWNLQGSSAATEAKWTNNVRQLVVGSNAASVLALQEAGTPPASAQLQGNLGNRLLDPQDLRQQVYEYKWNLGSASRPDYRWIYYTQNDLGANRVNLALVTAVKPDHVLILRPPGDYKSVRPILGVQFNKDNYFTIHASASGGGDAASIVNVIANYFGSRQEYDHQFMIMGDYNRSPAELRAALQRQHPDILNHVGIYAPATKTHRNGGILDYAVIGQYSYDLPNRIAVYAVTPSLSGQLVSDHTPVVFNVAQRDE
ncbi:unnamed protein product [Ceutorhynchus assimilis]|uniref:Endonuclease/exonuclease/phosphatase domain-containing protein n=1 Tax=Ceutorhynchus assimilis TaxID=467358 RepID=A0A9N9QS58_9CUCU|nr:unnamed protein product [Ceutorhynchus assimilis]